MSDDARSEAEPEDTSADPDAETSPDIAAEDVTDPAEDVTDPAEDVTDPAVDERGAAGPDAAKPPKLSKADKLSAKAEKLHLREARRAAEREERAEADGGGSQARSKRWVIATAVLAVATIGLVTVLVIGLFSWHHQREINDARSGSLTAAKAYAVAFGTYDYKHLDADFAKTSELMTPKFAKSYKKTSAALAKTFTAYKTKVTASVPEAAVISVSTDRAKVLVLLDQVITSSQSKTPKINRNRLKVSLVHSDGKWLVNRTDAT